MLRLLKSGNLLNLDNSLPISGIRLKLGKFYVTTFYIFSKKISIHLSIKIKDLLRALHVLILALFFVGSIQSQENEMSEYDTIIDLLNKVENGSQSDIEKLSFAENAKNLSLSIENDTLYNLSLRYIALYYYKLDLSLFLRVI